MSIQDLNLATLSSLSDEELAQRFRDAQKVRAETSAELEKRGYVLESNRGHRVQARFMGYVNLKIIKTVTTVKEI